MWTYSHSDTYVSVDVLYPRFIQLLPKTNETSSTVRLQSTFLLNLLNFRAESGRKRFGRNWHFHSYSGLVPYAAFRGVPNIRQTVENSLFK